MRHWRTRFTICCLLLFLCALPSSCVDKDLYEPKEEKEIETGYVKYLYHYAGEARDVVADITIKTNSEINAESVVIEVPVLKYNKSWLFMLTQDDHRHSAYSTTWAAINGKPLSRNYYYHTEQLAAEYLPPDAFSLNKTLGSTDGAGNEVRFAFTTTLYAEETPDNGISMYLKPDFSVFRQEDAQLTWNNLSEMLAYDTGIAFHDVNTNAVNQKDSLVKHFKIAQAIILDQLSGRGAKVLAEPNGNHIYLEAGKEYDPIQVMTAQNTKAGGLPVERHYPYSVETDLSKTILQRTFYNSVFDIPAHIENELKKEKEEREAIHVGMHSTGMTFVELLHWLNNEYGKDGDDSVWFPSLEEYYEYNYYRVNASIDKEVNGKTVKLRVSLPSEQYFYYPSITLNLTGINYEEISEISSGSSVTGLSYAPYEEGIMLNIDCRKFLVEHAEHFVDKYLESPTESNKRDAVYFVKKLKDSPVKEELGKKIPGYK
jgi:hypothetical protein